MTPENNEQPKAPEDKEVKNIVTQDKSKQKLVICAVIGILAALAIAIIIGVSALGDNNKKVQQQLELGEKYLEEMDYEQALVAFNAVLEIEPQNVDAYLGIVEVYIRTNEFDKALAYAKEGYEVTGDERLKEKIDMIESGDIFASNGWHMKMSGYDGEGNLVYWHEYTYNLKGRKASVAKYNAQGVQEQYLELDYDEEGRALTSYSHGVSEGDLSRQTIEYGSNGKCSRKIRYEGLSDVVRSYEEYEYNSEGKVQKEIDYDKDGNLNGTTIYEYDENGNRIKWEVYDTDNELLSYDIFTYDSAGKNLQQQHYDREGKLSSYAENVYDAEGNCIGRRHYNADGVLTSETKY